MLNVPLMWKETRGDGIVVVVIDTGVPNHLDIDVAQGDSVVLDYQEDLNGHATHCGGIIAAIAVPKLIDNKRSNSLNAIQQMNQSNDRMNYQRLLKYYDLIDNPDDKVCSIVCFLINPEYRRKGITQKILQQVTTDYQLLDYDYLEAYPGKGELSCERHYKGPLSLYKKNDFKIEKEFDDYYVVRKNL